MLYTDCIKNHIINITQVYVAYATVNSIILSYGNSKLTRATLAWAAAVVERAQKLIDNDKRNARL